MESWALSHPEKRVDLHGEYLFRMQIGPKQDVKNLKLGLGPISGFLIRMTPSCKEMTRLLSEQMDRPLPFRTRLTMRVHFLICKWCERYRNQLLFIRQAVRRHPEKLEDQDLSDPSTLSPEARERLKQSFRDR
ncbi:MAG: hypothetical protein ACT4OO_07765 [Nitrospiraceae bacterium]